MNTTHAGERAGDVLRREEGGGLERKVCVPKRAQINISFRKNFIFSHYIFFLVQTKMSWRSPLTS